MLYSLILMALTPIHLHPYKLHYRLLSLKALFLLLKVRLYQQSYPSPKKNQATNIIFIKKKNFTRSIIFMFFFANFFKLIPSILMHALKKIKNRDIFNTS